MRWHMFGYMYSYDKLFLTAGDAFSYRVYSAYVGYSARSAVSEVFFVNQFTEV